MPRKALKEVNELDILDKKLFSLDEQINVFKEKIQLLEKEKEETMAKRDEVEEKDFELTQAAQVVVDCLLSHPVKDSSLILNRVIQILQKETNEQDFQTLSKSLNKVKKTLPKVKETPPETLESTVTNSEKSINYFPEVEVEKEEAPVNLIENPVPEVEEASSEEIEEGDTDLFDNTYVPVTGEFNKEEEEEELEEELDKEPAEIYVGDYVKTPNGFIRKVLDVEAAGENDSTYSYLTSIVYDPSEAFIGKTEWVGGNELRALPYSDFANKVYNHEGKYVMLLDDLKETGLGFGMLCETVDESGHPLEESEFYLNLEQLEKLTYCFSVQEK